jgi:rare lipoprotein A (peptidoglycan hydrolase)
VRALPNRSILAALFLSSFCLPATAGGWATVHIYVHKTGRCGADREVLASFYGTGAVTANGERFNPRGVTAASHDYALGSTITVINPQNGRTCQVRINDRGPNGLARAMGARIDFALGARDCLGMVASQYVCAPAPDVGAVDRHVEKVARVPIKQGSIDKTLHTARATRDARPTFYWDVAFGPNVKPSRPYFKRIGKTPETGGGWVSSGSRF